MLFLNWETLSKSKEAMFHQEFLSDVFALWLFTIIHTFVSYALQSTYEQESVDRVPIKAKILHLSWEFSLDMFANTFTVEAEDIKDELGAFFIFYWSNMEWMRIWPWKCCTVNEGLLWAPATFLHQKLSIRKS